VIDTEPEHRFTLAVRALLEPSVRQAAAQLSQQNVCVEYQTGNGRRSPKNTTFGERIREDGLGEALRSSAHSFVQIRLRSHGFIGSRLCS
jgi:hypothetical protein